MQILIWQEKIERMNVIRSMALHQSFKDTIKQTERGATITIKFLQYGIYQALGVGNGYRHDNGGDLHFLDKDYRVKHRLDKPRKVGPAWGGYMTSGEPRERRDWYSLKLYMSKLAMVEDLANIYGAEAAAVFCKQLTDPRFTSK